MVRVPPRCSRNSSRPPSTPCGEPSASRSRSSSGTCTDRPSAGSSVQDPAPVVLGQEAGEVRVGRVEGDANRHRLAVTQPIAGQVLELVRRPVPEVERPRRAELERVAARRDVRQVQRRAAVDDLLHRREVAVLQRRGVALDEVEEGAVLDERRLDRLGHPGPPVAIGQRRQERRVVDHRERRRERAEIVLLAEGVDAVLDAHRRVVLRQHRRRQAHQADAAMRRRRGIAGRIEHRAAADGDDVGVAADAAVVDRAVDRVDGAAGRSSPPRRRERRRPGRQGRGRFGAAGSTPRSVR